MIIALIRISALLPGVSKEADEQKQEAKETMYEKEYVRGSILDRAGNALAYSEEAGGDRIYPSAKAFSNVIGYWSKTYGTYGVEKTLNTQLVHSASGKGDKRGADVTLTLDKKLQEKAYDAIKDFTGSAVVMNAKTGELLCLASTPSFSLQNLEEDWEEINSQDGVLLSNAFQNPVVPGSVFKLITSKGILENHLEEEKVDDQGSLKVNGQTIKNYNGTAHGTLSFTDGFVKSSNVYFMTMALEMGGQTLKECADSFLLGQDIPLDFTTLHSTFDLGDYEDNQVASTAFGQGSTLVTPLQMAMVTQSVANDGKMVKPYLFQSVVNGKGKVLLEGETEELTETMSAQVAKKIRKVMREAGESYGLSTVGEEDWQISAKTGTAERGDGTNNAWMVTFAPADDPQYVIVVNRLKTKEIGKSLAPVVEELYEYLAEHY
jgi:peptidoglycan glycosyltransferase